MPKPTKGPRFGGSPAHQRIILANLASQLFQHGKITTTEAKAKRVQPLADRLISKAKRGDLHNRRIVLQTITDKGVVHVLFTEIAPKLADREGGYTRITKIGPRKGDNAPMAVIEVVSESVEESRKAQGQGQEGRRAGEGCRAGQEGSGQEGRRQEGRRCGRGEVEAVEVEAPRWPRSRGRGRDRLATPSTSLGTRTKTRPDLQLSAIRPFPLGSGRICLCRGSVEGAWNNRATGSWSSVAPAVSAAWWSTNCSGVASGSVRWSVPAPTPPGCGHGAWASPSGTCSTGSPWCAP